MTHIAFLIPTVDRIGGAEQQVLLLAQGLARRNRMVSVIALSGTGGGAEARLRSQGVEFLSLHMRRGMADPRGWIQLRHWIKAHQPDVVHAHLPHAVLMARFSRFVAPVRVLVETIHSPAAGGLLRRFAYRLSAGQPDAIAAVSRAAAEPWLAREMLAEAQLAIIPNGIDLEHWRYDSGLRLAARQRLGLCDEFVWLAVGRLDPVKDHATLIRAFAGLAARARLLIVGAGPLESALRREADELCIGGKVRFFGFQSDVLPWIQAADAFVLSSRWEGLPMAFLEAAACQVPAVFTDIPAMRELFPDRSDRPVVPVGDPAALAAAMNATMETSERERRALGETSRKTVAARYSFSSVLDRWDQTYCTLLALKAHPSRSGVAPSTLRGRTFQLQ